MDIVLLIYGKRTLLYHTVRGHNQKDYCTKNDHLRFQFSSYLPLRIVGAYQTISISCLQFWNQLLCSDPDAQNIRYRTFDKPSFGIKNNV